MAIGTTSPPIAPTIGNTAVRSDDSDPLTNSRFTSVPMMRKNSGISASLIHSAAGRANDQLP
jgi:hypothetical protein